jgi:hypothetical protein
MELDGSQVVLIIGIGAGVLGLVLKYAFRSKCDRVKLFWGCMDIHRAVGQENNQHDAEPDLEVEIKG